jgi:hypothetical protein
MELKEAVGVGLAYLMQLAIVIIVIISIFRRNYAVIIWGVLALIITLIPLILKRKWAITLPWTLNFLIALSLFLHVWGMFGGWFHAYHPFYDKFAHFISSVTVALLGFTSVLIIDRYTEVELTKKSVIIFVVIFTLAVGAIWEIGEFTFDQVFGTNAQYDGLSGTMYDLILDLFGGIAAGFIAYIRLRRGKEKFINKLLRAMKVKVR